MLDIIDDVVPNNCDVPVINTEDQVGYSMLYSFQSFIFIFQMKELIRCILHDPNVKFAMLSSNSDVLGEICRRLKIEL